MPALTRDPDFWEVFKPFAGMEPPIIKDPIEFRDQQTPLVAAMYSMLPPPPSASDQGIEVRETLHSLRSFDGAEIAVHRFEPVHIQTGALQNQGSAADLGSGSVESKPAVIYLHGGGFIMGSVEVFKPNILRYVRGSGVQFFAVAYRLAPEHPFPAALEDAYAAVTWLRDKAATLGVDPGRVALYGTSAGAALALGAALKLRDDGFPDDVGKLVLEYPMLDDRTDWESAGVRGEFLSWTAQQNSACVSFPLSRSFELHVGSVRPETY
jgi:acetyl esterase/lipase